MLLYAKELWDPKLKQRCDSCCVGRHAIFMNDTKPQSISHDTEGFLERLFDVMYEYDIFKLIDFITT